jgi:hypothetical protein
VDEDPVYSLPANVSLAALLAPNFDVVAAAEWSLTANRQLGGGADADAAGYRSSRPPCRRRRPPRQEFSDTDPNMTVRLLPMEVRTFVIELRQAQAQVTRRV